MVVLKTTERTTTVENKEDSIVNLSDAQYLAVHNLGHSKEMLECYADDKMRVLTCTTPGCEASLILNKQTGVVLGSMMTHRCGDYNAISDVATDGLSKGEIARGNHWRFAKDLPREKCGKDLISHARSVKI